MSIDDRRAVGVSGRATRSTPPSIFRIAFGGMTATVFGAAKAAHGPTTFGVFSCSKATNEVNFAAQKFSRSVLGSNNIDSCNRT